MSDCDCCQNFNLIRKQREEIILLTNELKRQEEQINSLHSSNLKYKESTKLKEKKEKELEKAIKSLELEIRNLNEQLKLKSDDLETVKQKLAQKDSYIQNQSNKIFQLQTQNDKSAQELNYSIKYKSETKSENAKLQSKIKEQSNRILELKEQNIEVVRTLESRNSLIKTSSDHIQVLEQNLLDCLSLLKTNEKTDASTYTSQIEVQEEFKPIDTHCTNELKLISVLHALKETWLESNLKYEEVKNLVSNEFKDNVLADSIINDCETANSIEQLRRIFTSSPIFF